MYLLELALDFLICMGGVVGIVMLDAITSDWGWGSGG